MKLYRIFWKLRVQDIENEMDLEANSKEEAFKRFQELIDLDDIDSYVKRIKEIA